MLVSSVPAIVTLPVTASLSDCPAVVPPRSMTTVPVDPITRLPVIESVPAVPAVAGEIVPLLVSVLPAPMLMVPAPHRVPELVKAPAVRCRVAPVETSIMPELVKVGLVVRFRLTEPVCTCICPLLLRLK